MSAQEQVPSRSIKRLTETLKSLNLDYAIVGGVAVALVATPRFTADIDAVLLNIDDRLEWLVAELQGVGYTSRAIDPIAFARRTRVLAMKDQDEVGIDLMLGILPFDEDLVHRALTVEMDIQTTVSVASPEHLVIMKAIAWRPKDLEDIRQLVAMNPNLDRDFVMTQFSDYAELLEIPERIPDLEALLL